MVREEIGRVEAIFRYPVKSMAGERLESASLGWHGVEGDRRLAVRRMNERSGMPWLTASRVPDLLLYTPIFVEDGAPAPVPSHVRTPNGDELPVLSEELTGEIGTRFGGPVQMMQLRHGIFDETPVSVITVETIEELGRLSGRPLDVRQFRPNIVVRLGRAGSFQEDEWVGKVLTIGEGDESASVAVTMRDERCGMVNLDPDSARPYPEVMKTIVRVNGNHAGVYGVVTRIGRVAVGDTVFLAGQTN